jgi:hypothetical protein
LLQQPEECDDRTEVVAVSGAEAVAELIDGPQVDACGVQRRKMRVEPQVFGSGWVSFLVSAEDPGTDDRRELKCMNRR